VLTPAAVGSVFSVLESLETLPDVSALVRGLIGERG